MIIEFKSTKACKCYKEFIEDPTVNAKRRKFVKLFGSIEEESLKLHERLKSFPNAGAYNKIYGVTENRIELVKGIKDKNP